MKKSLIALAVAGAFAAPAFAASSNVDVYGKLRMSVDHISTSGAGSDGWQIADRVSRLGFKGSEDLGGGLKAVWQIETELGIDTTRTATSQDIANRNTFVGLAGGFGTVLLGRHDTPYKLAGSADLFGDTAADSQKSGTGIIGRNGFDTRASNTLAYVSPTWSGFSFAGAVIPGEELSGTGAANDANGLADSYSVAAFYANGPLSLSAGYESYGGETASTVATGAADKTGWKLNASYTIGDAKIGLTYENADDTNAAAGVTTEKEDTAILASLAYGMGPITLAAQYGKYDQKDTNATKNDDLTRWTVGAIYSLSKRTSAYVAYNSDDYGTATGGTNMDTKVWTMGLNHDF